MMRKNRSATDRIKYASFGKVSLRRGFEEQRVVDKLQKKKSKLSAASSSNKTPEIQTVDEELAKSLHEVNMKNYDKEI